jgi:hypothetical protein
MSLLVRVLLVFVLVRAQWPCAQISDPIDLEFLFEHEYFQYLNTHEPEYLAALALIGQSNPEQPAASLVAQQQGDAAAARAATSLRPHGVADAAITSTVSNVSDSAGAAKRPRLAPPDGPAKASQDFGVGVLEVTVGLPTLHSLSCVPTSRCLSYTPHCKALHSLRHGLQRACMAHSSPAFASPTALAAKGFLLSYAVCMHTRARGHLQAPPVRVGRISRGLSRACASA